MITEENSQVEKQFLLKQNIEQKFGPPYRPKCQGVVESQKQNYPEILREG